MGAGKAASFTSFFGGKLVDGLPPAYFFEVKRNFSILFLRFLWSGKFIFLRNIFPVKIMCIGGLM